MVATAIEECAKRENFVALKCGVRLSNSFSSVFSLRFVWAEPKPDRSTLPRPIYVRSQTVAFSYSASTMQRQSNEHMKHSETAGRSVLISAIDLASVPVVAKFNKFEGAWIQLLQATCPPSLKQRRLLIFSQIIFSFEFGWVVNTFFCGVMNIKLIFNSTLQDL